jgi:hypothetical protein
MKRRSTAATAAGAALTALVLAGCGSGLDHGVITGKSYDPPWTYWMHTCVSYSKYGACQVSILVPVDEPAEYALSLKDGKQTGSVDVDEATWDAVRVGEHWPPAAGTPS